MNNINRVLIEKPDLPVLTKNHTVVDLHFHSSYSDGKNSVMEIAKRARKLGIGIAITDHNDIRGAVEINRMKGVFSIPGIEVTSKEGTHVLVYFSDINRLRHFYTESIKPHMGIDVMSAISLEVEMIIQRAKQLDAMTIFPHPFGAAYMGVCNSIFSPERQQRLFDLIDGVEALNASNLKKSNLRSTVLGFNLDKNITGGSDGHTLKHMGKAVTYADCRKDRKAFLEALNSGQNKVIGKEIAIIKKVTSNGMKLKNNIKNYPHLIEKNIKYSYTVINAKSKNLRDNMKLSLNEKIRNGRDRKSLRG
jgi:predicted metal-dependent phosphoesterase TrpH